MVDKLEHNMFLIEKIRHLFIEKRAKEEIKLDGDLIVLTVLASLLAAYGVNLGRTHLIIASMLVSPLFNPIIAIVIFLIKKDGKNLLSAIGSLLAITLMSVFVSGAFFYILKMVNLLNDFSYVTPPVNVFNILGLSLLIGSVGSLLWLWPKAPTISSGLAIAISLVPPVVRFSAGLVLGEYSAALNYLLIFGLNLAGILFSSTVIFLFRFENKLPDVA